MLAGDHSRPESSRRTVPVIGAQAAFPAGGCGGLRTILLPATVKTAPQESVNCPARSLTGNVTQAARRLAGAGQESARCRRAPQSYDRSPSRPAVEWRVARMPGFDGGTPRPCPRINAVGTEAADSATLPRVLGLPSVNVADLAFKSVAR